MNQKSMIDLALNDLAREEKRRNRIEWNTPIREKIRDQFLIDYRGEQPTDKRIKEVMQKVVPKNQWRIHISPKDKVKDMIHQAQGTEPRKDQAKSDAGFKSARTRRLRAHGKQFAEPPTKLFSRNMSAEEIKQFFKGRKCLLCAEEGRLKMLNSPSYPARFAHFFRRHTAEGQKVARRAGQNFRASSNGVKKFKPWEKKKAKKMGRQLGRPRKDRVFEVNQIMPIDPYDQPTEKPTQRAVVKRKLIIVCPECKYPILRDRLPDHEVEMMEEASAYTKALAHE